MPCRCRSPSRWWFCTANTTLYRNHPSLPCNLRASVEMFLLALSHTLSLSLSAHTHFMYKLHRGQITLIPSRRECDARARPFVRRECRTPPPFRLISQSDLRNIISEKNVSPLCTCVRVRFIIAIYAPRRFHTPEVSRKFKYAINYWSIYFPNMLEHISTSIWSRTPRTHTHLM